MIRMVQTDEGETVWEILDICIKCEMKICDVCGDEDGVKCHRCGESVCDDCKIVHSYICGKQMEYRAKFAKKPPQSFTCKCCDEENIDNIDGVDCPVCDEPVCDECMIADENDGNCKTDRCKKCDE